MTRVLLALIAAALFASQEQIRFVAIDVFADPGEKPLGAWQIEVVSDAKLVGVERGDAPIDQKAPYYDPMALQGGRVVIAAFTTKDDPPAGRIRVARLHFQETGAAKYSSKLITAASPGVGRIEVKIELIPSGEKK